MRVADKIPLFVTDGLAEDSVEKRFATEHEAKLEDLQKQITIEKAKSAFRLSKADIVRFYKAGLEKEPIKLINHLIKEPTDTAPRGLFRCLFGT